MVSSEVETLTSKGVDVGAEFEAEYGPASGGAKTQVTMSKSQKDAFGKMSKKTKTVVVGGNPPSDLKKGFGEWAGTVATSPMPVKYTVRPLSSANSKYLDLHSYNVMVNRYMGSQLKKAKDRQNAVKANAAAGPFVLKPGESWTSDHSAGYTHKGTTLKITTDGRIVITDKFNRGLWDSIYHDWASNGGTYTLTYQTDGDLVLKNDKGNTMWHSVTPQSLCSGTAKEARFENGLLTISDNAGVKWSSMTRDGAAKTKMAAVEYFGIGKNECLTKDKCVTIFKENNYKGGKCSMGPTGGMTKDKVGYYNSAWLNKCDGLNDENYSARVNKDICWVELWEDDDFDSTGFGSGDYDFYMQNEGDCSYVHTRDNTKTDSVQGSDDANAYLVHSTADYQVYFWMSHTETSGDGYTTSGLGMPSGQSYDTIFAKYTATLKQYYSACMMTNGNVFCP